MRTIMRTVCLLALGCWIAAVPRPALADDLLLADFNAEPLNAPIGTGGAALGQPVSVGGAITAIVRDAPFATPSLEIADNNDEPPAGNAGAASFEFLDGAEITSGVFTINAELWFDSYDNYFVFVREQGGAAESFLSLEFVRQGPVVGRDKSGNLGVLGSYETGRRYPISVVYDMDAGTYDLYLDGCLVLEDEEHGVIGRGVGSVLFGAEHDLDLDGKFSVDNIAVRTGSNPVARTGMPRMSCPGDVTVEGAEQCGTPASHERLEGFFAGATATDVCGNALDVTNDAPDCFPLGTTTVTFNASDVAGNNASCTADVTVVDTTPPRLQVVLSRTELWPPNHKMVEVCARIRIADACDPNPTYVLWSVTSDEPDNGQGDGNTVDDIQDASIGRPDPCVSLRAERQGHGDGRTYTIVYVATDASGNRTRKAVQVFVPHSQGASAAPGTDETALHAFPEPVRGGNRATVEFSVPDGAAGATTELDVIDIAGRRVARIETAESSGTVRVDWHVADERGEPLRPGVYFYRLRVGVETRTLKFVVADQ